MQVRKLEKTEKEFSQLEQNIQVLQVRAVKGQDSDQILLDRTSIVLLILLVALYNEL